MDPQPRAVDLRASTTDQPGEPSRLLPPSERRNEVLLAHRSPSISIRRDTTRKSDYKSSGAIPVTEPRIQSSGAPISLPSFQESFAHITPPSREPVDPLREINRDSRPPASEIDHSSSLSHEPRYEQYVRDAPREYKRSLSSDPISYAPRSPSKRRFSVEHDGPVALHRYHSEGTSVGLREAPYEAPNAYGMHSAWDPRPNSSGLEGSNSSARSSPRRSYRIPSVLPPLDFRSRGLEARRLFDPQTYTYESDRPRARTKPQSAGSYALPSIADSYHYEQPRHTYSYSGSSHSTSYQPLQAHYHSQSQGSSYQYPERSPFTAASPQSSYYMDNYVHNQPLRNRELINPKQRKRRGNLPKETTDKLRHWFNNNTHHAYPTEEQKQQLCRETGLQMNQISNWFINARRRKLPDILKAQEEMSRRQSDTPANSQSVSIKPAEESVPSTSARSGLPTPSDSLSPRRRYVEELLNIQMKRKRNVPDDSDDDEDYFVDDPLFDPSLGDQQRPIGMSNHSPTSAQNLFSRLDDPRFPQRNYSPASFRSSRASLSESSSPKRTRTIEENRRHAFVSRLPEQTSSNSNDTGKGNGKGGGERRMMA